MMVLVKWSKRHGAWKVWERRAAGEAWHPIGYARRLNVRDAKLRVMADGGAVRGTLEGAAWISSLPYDMRRIEYTSWLKSDRVYRDFGTRRGECVTYRADFDADSWVVIGEAGGVWTGRQDRIERAEMVTMEAAGVSGAKRGNVWAFDPCSMTGEA